MGQSGARFCSLEEKKKKRKEEKGVRSAHLKSEVASGPRVSERMEKKGEKGGGKAFEPSELKGKRTPKSYIKRRKKGEKGGGRKGSPKLTHLLRGLGREKRGTDHSPFFISITLLECGRKKKKRRIGQEGEGKEKATHPARSLLTEVEDKKGGVKKGGGGDRRANEATLV